MRTGNNIILFEYVLFSNELKGFEVKVKDQIRIANSENKQKDKMARLISSWLGDRKEKMSEIRLLLQFNIR